MKIKFSVCCIVVALSICFLTCCSGGISGDEAKSYAWDFLNAIADGDFEAAQGYVHPDYRISVEYYAEETEKDLQIDLQDGIELKKYTGFSSSYYTSEVSGSAYELNMKATVSEKEVDITVEIVKNEAGYGIYSFYIG